MESLLQRVQEAEAIPDEEMLRRMTHGKFTLDDLYHQLKSIKKVGKFRQVLSMMGGGNIPSITKEEAENNLEQWEVLLNSMTKEEKEDPIIIKKSQKKRISIGSGISYSVINKMLKEYNKMKKMMKRFMQEGKNKHKGKRGDEPFPNIFGGPRGPFPGAGASAKLKDRTGKELKF